MSLLISLPRVLWITVVSVKDDAIAITLWASPLITANADAILLFLDHSILTTHMALCKLCNIKKLIVSSIKVSSTIASASGDVASAAVASAAVASSCAFALDCALPPQWNNPHTTHPLQGGGGARPPGVLDQKEEKTYIYICIYMHAHNH